MNEKAKQQDITKITISEENAHQRLDQAIATLLPDFSRTEIKDWIKKGYLLVNGEIIKASSKLKGGEIVSIAIPPRTTLSFMPENIPLTIVHEDDAVLLINKQPGLVVHPGAGNHDHTLLNALLHHAPGLAELPRAGIIHRLDKDTSGLLIIAKTNKSFKALTHQLKERSMVREYQAIVYGHLISGGSIDAPIGRHHIQRKKMAVTDVGKEAITHYRIINKYRCHTHLTLKLETGRTHQIRVHLSHIHHPIVGDKLYGGHVKLGKNTSEELIQQLRQFKRQALHAFALGFIHPESEEFMRFETKLPNDIQELIQALKNDSAMTS